MLGIIRFIRFLGWLLVAIAGFFTPLFITHYAVKKRFSAFFEFREALNPVIKDPLSFVVVVIFSSLVAAGWFILGIILLGVGLLFTIPAAVVSVAYMYGVFYSHHNMQELFG